MQSGSRESLSSPGGSQARPSSAGRASHGVGPSRIAAQTPGSDGQTSAFGADPLNELEDAGATLSAANEVVPSAGALRLELAVLRWQ